MNDFIKELESKLKEVSDLNKHQELKSSYLGKSGFLTTKLKELATLSVEEKKSKGQELHKLKIEAEALLAEKQKELEEEVFNLQLIKDKVDITLPVETAGHGSISPLSKTVKELVSIFETLGFSVEEGPEVEDEWYNFGALNFADNHPAKEDHDTFYFKNQKADESKKLLRTHTSNTQIRTMLKAKPPIKIIVPGRVYRSDDDSTHSPVFHQVEGLYIAEKVSIRELKGVLSKFLSEFFGLESVPLRFRPSYFPFTEPSMEVDIGCNIDKAKGIIEIGKGENWLEILGCGMVHPKVLENCNIDSNIYSGYAFGMGIERITMLKYGFSDLRAFFNSDYKWFKHYGFNVLNS